MLLDSFSVIMMDIHRNRPFHRRYWRPGPRSRKPLPASEEHVDIVDRTSLGERLECDVFSNEPGRIRTDSSKSPVFPREQARPGREGFAGDCLLRHTLSRSKHRFLASSACFHLALISPGRFLADRAPADRIGGASDIDGPRWARCGARRAVAHDGCLHDSAGRGVRWVQIPALVTAGIATGRGGALKLV